MLCYVKESLYSAHSIHIFMGTQKQNLMIKNISKKLLKLAAPGLLSDTTTPTTWSWKVHGNIVSSPCFRTLT